ncbi:hypothetical protein HDV62DRAFT_210288 [Trichoderma sp. SZMC 28011]
MHRGTKYTLGGLSAQISFFQFQASAKHYRWQVYASLNFDLYFFRYCKGLAPVVAGTHKIGLNAGPAAFHSLFALPAAHTVPITGAPVLFIATVHTAVGFLSAACILLLSPHIDTATICILISSHCIAR